VLITVVCPACENSYKVQPSLRGQAMRCPDPQCRHVFTVPAEEPPSAPPQPGNGQQTGSVGDIAPLLPARVETPASWTQPSAPSSPHVGDIVPLIQAEAVKPAAPAAKATPAWMEPPPVRRTINPPAPAPLPHAVPMPPADPAPPAVKAPPREMAAGTWEPPPVRRDQPSASNPSAEPAAPMAPEPPPAEAPEAPADDVHVTHSMPAKRTGLIVAAFVLVVVVLLGGGAVMVWRTLFLSEGQYADAAAKEYDEDKFSEAQVSFKQLYDEFPTSERRDYYQMMQGLSGLRLQAAAPDPDVTTVLDHLHQFISDNKDKNAEELKKRVPDLGKTIGRLTAGFVQRNPHPQDDGPLAAAERLEQSLARLTELNPEVPSVDLRNQVAKDLGGLRQAVAQVKKFHAAVAKIAEAANAKPGSLAVRQVIKQIKAEEVDQPGIGQQPEVAQIRNQVFEAHLRDIVYKPEEGKLPAAAHVNDETSFVIDPWLNGAPQVKPSVNDPIVLALSRGVLYALNRTNGQVKWVVRVGVDDTALPIRVPEKEGVPERILVPSADARTLDALDADGERLWQYRLAKECIGRPLVVGNLAYLATYDGKVHEIELAQGKLLGVYDLGQPLTVGGVRDPATGLLYFPGDDFCVYVLDPRKRQCDQVLYTGHPAGSLRGEPLVVVAPDGQGNDVSWLILNQTHGLDATRLRIYHLPIADREASPEKLTPEPEAHGWTWFPPYHDGEQVAMLGDTGVLALFGIRQPRNLNDPLLFPILPNSLDLGAGAKSRGRSEMVEVQDHDFWVLAGGELKRLYKGLNPAAGPQLTPAVGWKPLALGSPLHATQVEVDRARNGTTLVLATQPLAQQITLATAVDDREGEILWQRQLGLVCQGDPVELRPPGGKGPPVVLALDQGGGLFAFDPAQKRHANLIDGEWRDGGESLFPAMDDGLGGPPVLLPAPDGQSAYEIASPGDGKQLVIRRVAVGAGGLTKEPPYVLPLPSPLAGTPAVTDAMMVLPLSDGVLAQLALPLTAASHLVEGPDWRSRRAAADARGRVTALTADSFLAGDGARGLTHWQWPPTKLFKSLPAGKDTPTLEWEGSLTADPILLPEVKGAPRLVCIADVAGGVTVLTVANNGDLKPGRGWDLGGQITAGPYIDVLPDGATRIACVVNDTQLVWLDPDKNGVLWKHSVKPGAHLVGRPRLVGGLVVVADGSGCIVGLDPEKGEPVGREYQLQGSAAPAASPVGFGADRLFVPLTDGTVLLPKVESLRIKN
jgi:outer membrane protein assembly factor BamB